MPTYEYECTACGQHIEVFQRFTEEPLKTCVVCGGPLRKVFHPAGIVFKGSGFYSTDSRAKSGSSPKKEGGSSSDSSSDSSSSSGSSGSSSSDSSSSSGSTSSASTDSSSDSSGGAKKEKKAAPSKERS
jgi:putative FmdB family regulatory protein